MDANVKIWGFELLLHSSLTAEILISTWSYRREVNLQLIGSALAELFTYAHQVSGYACDRAII